MGVVMSVKSSIEELIDKAVTSSMESASVLMMLYEEAEFLLLRVRSLEKENDELTKDAKILQDELDKLKDVEKAASIFLEAVKSKRHTDVSSGIKKLHTAIHKVQSDPNKTEPPK
jgi:hypothetical protein